MSIASGLDDIAYVLPGSYLKHGNQTKMYMIFYSYDDGCYFSVTLTSQGQKAPKKEDSWMYLQHPDPSNRRWYLFQYKPLELANRDAEPTEFLMTTWLPKKIKADKSKSPKVNWVPWTPTAEERQFLEAHMHRWQYEHQANDFQAKCRAPPPPRNFSCEMKHAGRKQACMDDYTNHGMACNPLDEACLPECYFDESRKLCQNLPHDDSVRRRAKGDSDRDSRMAGMFRDVRGTGNDTMERQRLFDAVPQPVAIERRPSLRRPPTMERMPSFRREPSMRAPPVMERVPSFRRDPSVAPFVPSTNTPPVLTAEQQQARKTLDDLLFEGL